MTLLTFGLTILLFSSYYTNVEACTDFYMNFTNFKLSARTLDLGLMSNWTITIHPSKAEESYINHDIINWDAKIASVGITANWFGDEFYGFPSLFADSLNIDGLSCSLLALTNTQYEEKSKDKLNIFAGTFCLFVAQSYNNIKDLANDLQQSIVVWGPSEIAQHFIIRDNSGASLVLEFVNGQKMMYLDLNDVKTGYGITTNEPYFDFHLKNINHYEWKRTLARQAVAIPGNFYPEERFLRVHMVKSGMQDMGLMAGNSNSLDISEFQNAFSLTVQVLNTVSVPQGNQYGTDSGQTSGEGDSDHTCWAIVRDHNEPAIYWRDATNPTFRKLNLQEALQSNTKKSIKLEAGPFFIDMTNDFK